ncbi:uncharacterized protein Dwil_GK16965 [Drosophila willistoni]|uniref:Myb/SANT-like DNA-binding domain-containing protein n=1 Tax=Drosophila willistoni TaxID=7260 RepID=B4MLI1_DROWI|nr:golgin subfamily A member 6-like protein 22 [Drosophila willistoni]EDW72837.2 uncharacterized protein Dwil_GK16965 [Drosophila willistoni]
MRPGNRSHTRRSQQQSPRQRRILSESEEYQEELDIEELNKQAQDEKRRQSKYLTRNTSKRPLFLLLGEQEEEDYDQEEEDQDDGDDEEFREEEEREFDGIGDYEAQDDEIGLEELNSKNECIRQINAIHPEPKYPFKRKEGRFLWSPEATSLLLDLWKASRMELVTMSKKNTTIYKRITEKLRGFGLRHLEVKSKMDNMARKYRIEADKVRNTGEPSKWEYFHKTQACLIGTKSVDVFEEIMFEKSATAADDTNSRLDEDSEINDESTTNFIKLEDNTEEIDPDPEPEPEMPIEDDEPKESKKFIKNSFSNNQENCHANEQLDESCAQSTTIAGKSKKRKIADTLMRIEEEKLAIEKEKLQIMKQTSKELKLFHRDLLRMFKEK